MPRARTRLCTFRLNQPILDDLEWLRKAFEFRNTTTALAYAIAFAKSENWVADAKRHAREAKERRGRQVSSQLKPVRPSAGNRACDPSDFVRL